VPAVPSVPSPRRLAGSAVNAARTAWTLQRSGVLRPGRPDRIAGAALALARFGPTPAAGYAASAARHPDARAVIDDAGTLTFRDVDRRANALAHALADRGFAEGDALAVLCRNSRHWIEATVAASKLGVHAIFLNTGASGPQLAEVVRHEGPRGIVYDAEFAGAARAAARHRERIVAWRAPGERGGRRDATVEALIAAGDPGPVRPPRAQGRAVILTSGTTGAPKGAARAQPRNLDPVAALLEAVPLRARETTVIAAPLFHAWGFAHFMLAMALSSTLVLRRRFDPEGILALAAEHEATALVAVPVMLQRILELPEPVLDAVRLPALRTVALSGSALPRAVSDRWMDRFGEHLYNLYGSTEVAWATVAGPRDLREAPGTAGRPPRGTVLRLLGEDGAEAGPGETGRIFVGNDLQFEGYTGGGGRDVVEGLMASGDVGHLDAQGRLFVDGRDDDMIVSGGENVFPGEVEELLLSHPAIADAAVLGVDDERFGQRLKAVVVRRPEAELTAGDVQEHVKARLAGYKVPRDVEFRDELPRTSTGKVLKRRLAGGG
jgi:acyl-CoA synthetase (AMP-forming)/AMP-acid ligase II